MTNLARCLAQDGYAVAPNVVPLHTLCRLRVAIEQARQNGHPDAVANSSGVFGIRNLADVVPEVAELSNVAGVGR